MLWIMGKTVEELYNYEGKLVMAKLQITSLVVLLVVLETQRKTVEALGLKKTNSSVVA